MLWMNRDGRGLSFWVGGDAFYDEDTDKDDHKSFDEACEPNAGPPDGDNGYGCPICGYCCVEPECVA